MIRAEIAEITRKNFFPVEAHRSLFDNSSYKAIKLELSNKDRCASTGKKFFRIISAISALIILFPTTLLPYPTLAFAGLKCESHVVRLYRELSSYNTDETSHTHMTSTLV